MSVELPPVMRHTLHSHIIYLENTIQDLKNRLTSPRLTADEILDLQMQLTLAESALTHYREAYALELSVAGSEPSGEPGSETSGSGNPEISKREKKKGGQAAAIEARARRRAARIRRTVTASRSRTPQHLSMPAGICGLKPRPCGKQP